jgi:hypothetical protein
MSFHGSHGWGSDLADRSTIALDATTYEAGETFEVVVAKKHNGPNRYLEFTMPGDAKFLLTRDGIEDLKLFLDQ